LVRKSGGKKPYGTPEHRWEDTTKMGPQELGWEDVEWIYLVQDRDQWQGM
jgi:hypothetical protein